MVRQVTATEAKAHLLSLLDEVSAGGDVLITKRGRPVARLVSAVSKTSARGMHVGVAVTVVDDEDELFTTGERWDAD